MMKKTIVFLTFALLMTVLTGGIVGADNIKDRMKARLPAIKALKAQGILGENNQGYLEFLGEKKEKEEVVKAENSDRKTVYTAIAKKQGTTAEVVGKRRALKIAEKAKVGEWFQDESGKWNQRK